MDALRSGIDEKINWQIFCYFLFFKAIFSEFDMFPECSRSEFMGQIGIWQIVIVAVVVVLLFGRGKISDLMGDVAKGITSFKKGLKDEETKTADAIDKSASEAVGDAKEKSKAS